MKRMNVLEEGVTMASAFGKQNMADMDALADAIAADLKK